MASIALMVPFSTGGFHSPGTSVRPLPQISSYVEAPHTKRGAWLHQAPWVGSFFLLDGRPRTSQQAAARLASRRWRQPGLGRIYQSLPLLRGRLWLCLQNTLWTCWRIVSRILFKLVLLCLGYFSSSSDFGTKLSFTSLCSAVAARSGWNPALDPEQKMIPLKWWLKADTGELDFWKLLTKLKVEWTWKALVDHLMGCYSSSPFRHHHPHCYHPHPRPHPSSLSPASS